MNLVDDLRKSILADNLNDEELNQLANIAAARTFYKNDSIFDEKDDGSSLYILVEGRVCIEIRSLQKRMPLPKQIMIVKRGQIFGEMAFVERRFRSASARAKGNVRLISIPSGDFDKLMQENPSLGFKVMTNLARILSRRLRRMNDQWLSAVAHEFPLPEFEYI